MLAVLITMICRITRWTQDCLPLPSLKEPFRFHCYCGGTSGPEIVARCFDEDLLASSGDQINIFAFSCIIQMQDASLLM